MNRDVQKQQKESRAQKEGRGTGLEQRGYWNAQLKVRPAEPISETLAQPHISRGGVSQRLILSQIFQSVNPPADLVFWQLSAPALLAKLSPFSSSTARAVRSGSGRRWLKGLLACGMGGFGATVWARGAAEGEVAWLQEGLLSVGVCVLFFGCLYTCCRAVWWLVLLLEGWGQVREQNSPTPPEVKICTPGEESTVTVQVITKRGSCER